MIKINNNLHYIYNPYKDPTPPIDEASHSHAHFSSHPPKDPIIEFADRIVNWGISFLFKDAEKAVDFIGFTAAAADSGASTVAATMQGAVYADKIFHFNIPNHASFLNEIPRFLKIILGPTAIVLFVLGIIEAFVEILHLRRMSRFLNHIEIEEQNPLIQLEWIKNRYFSINHKVAKKIQAYVEGKFPTLSNAQKGEHFERIAEKMLQIKFNCLERRLTPALAKEVSTQLNIILQDLKSSDVEVQKSATLRAQVLMKSVTAQAKTTIAIHTLCLIAITLTLFSFICVFVGILSSGPILIAIGVFSSCLLFLAFVLRKTSLSKEVGRLYDNLMEVKLPTMALIENFQGKRAVCLHFHNELQKEWDHHCKKTNLPI